MNMTRAAEEFPWTVTERSEGLHMTPIIEDLLATLYGARDETPDEERRLQFEKGYLWERVLSMAYGESAAFRPGEVDCDGVLCSPDGIVVEDGEVVVEEYKATAFSSVKTPDQVPRYMMQIKGYCYAMGAVRARMRILYLNGNSRDVRHPQYEVFEFTFTQSELAENWAAILAHARGRGWL